METNETYFLRELEHLKTSADSNFRHLYYAIRPWSVSLPMILLHLKDIIKALLRFLDRTKPELVPAVLSLIGILSRDMRSEFYPYFDIVLQCFIAKIEEWKTMPEQLEALFTTIARSFKFLERYLLKDLKSVFLLYKDFFLTRKEHVRQFAAESFAYLLRKLPFSKLNEMIEFMLSQLPLPSEDEDIETQRHELADGIGFLLFYVVQGIKGKLTTSSVRIVPLVCSKLALKSYLSEDDMEVDEDEEDDHRKAPTLHLKAKSVLDTKVVEESLDSRYLVLLRFVKSIRAHFHNDDCPILWEALTKLFASIFAENADLSRDQFRTVGYTFSLVSEYIHNRHLPNMSEESQKPFLDRALAFLAIPKAVCNSPSPPVPNGSSYTREALERLAIDYAVPLFEIASNEHSSAATSVRKETRQSLDRLFNLLDAHPAIAYRFALGLKHTALFKHYLLPLTLQFVDKQLKRVESASSSASPHPAVKDALWFVYTLASDLDWSTMLGAANMNVATRSIQFPSDKLAAHCLTLLSDLKPAYFEDPTHLATMWMAICTVSYIQVNSAELVSSLDSALSAFLDCLLHKNSKFKRVNLPENTRDLLIGQTLTTRCQLASSSGNRHTETSLQLLKQLLTETMDLLREGMGQAKRHLIQAFADMVQLAVLQPYGDPMRYLEARNLLKEHREFLVTLLDAIAVLTSHFNIMVRRSSWTLLKSLAELDDDLPIFTDLAIRCEAVANKHINPLEHRDISSQFPDIVELALKPSAKPFDRALAIRFLIGILFIQLTPLWQPAIKSLSRLHDVDSKTFWQVCLPLLKSAQSEIGQQHDSSLPSQASSNENADNDSNMAVDDETGSDAEVASQNIFLSREDPPSIDHLFEDVCNDSFRFTGASTFSDSLWNALNHASRSLPPASATAAIVWDSFLKFIVDHFPYIDDPARMHIFSQSVSSSEKDSAPKESSKESTTSKKKNTKKGAEDDEDDEEMPQLETVADSKLSRAAVGEIRKFLLHFLKFFGNFKNTTDVKKSDELFAVFEKLVALANPEIQLASLQCMSLFKPGYYILPYKPHLETLIQDSRGRTPFTEFPLLPSKSAILPEHRPELIPLIIRILFPKLTVTKFDLGRRTAVLAYLAQCEPQELLPLFELTLGSSLRCIESLDLPILQNNYNPLESTPSKTKGRPTKIPTVTVSQIPVPSIISSGQLIGSCKMVGDMVKAMGVSVFAFIPKLLTLSMWYLHLAQDSTAAKIGSGERVALLQANQLRKIAVRNITSILSFFNVFDYTSFKDEMIRLMLNEAKTALGIEILPDTSTFLEWCVAMSSRPHLISLLQKFVPFIIDLIKRDYVSLSVRSKLFTVIENLLRVRDEDAHADDKERNESIKKVAALAAATKGGKALNYNPGEIIAGLTAKQRAKMDPADLHAHMIDYALTLEYRAQSDILKPYSNDILDAMQMRLFADHAAKRRVGKRELIILEKLCRYATTSEHADKLGALILPFAKHRAFLFETRQRILALFSSLVPLMSEALVHTEAIKHLFIETRDYKCRSELGVIFQQLAKLDPALAEIGPHIESLNAMSKVQIDEPDYERRMEAYTELNENLIKTLDAHPLSFVIANYLFYTSHEDLSIRNNASFGLIQIVRRVAAQFEPDAVQSKSKSSKSVKPLPLVLVTETIFNQIKRQLNSPVELTRREHLLLLSAMVETMPVQFADLVPALGSTEESNFFLAIHHLQTYRRSRILTKLADLIRADKFPKSVLLQVFFPVIKQIILNATHKQHAVVDEAIKAIAAIAEKLDWRSYWTIVQTTLKGMEANKLIQNQWIKLLCTVLDTFHFDISKVYDDIVQETRPKKKSFKVTSEQEHFDEEAYEAQLEAQVKAQQAKDAKKEEEDEESEESGEEGGNGEETDSNPNTDEENGEGKEEGEETDSNPDTDLDASHADEIPQLEKANDAASGINYRGMAPEDLLQRQIQRTVVKSLLPTLLRLMKSGDPDKTRDKKRDSTPTGEKEKEERTVLRTNVVVCAVRLLSQLPDAMSHTHISMFVIEVSNQLASRATANRIAASASIQEILKVLGPTKFLFILDILVAQLSRGFQLHILCHTVHNLLKSLQPIVKPGEIDEGLPMLNKIFFEDMIGRVAEQKKVSKIVSAIGGEASKTWAYESIGIVAQLIDFESSIRTLIDPIIDVILATTDVKVIKKMKQALDQISVGIRTNSSVTPERLCIFVYRLVDQYSSQKATIGGKDEPKSDLERTWIVEANPYKQGTYAAATQITGKEVDNDHVIVAYALQVLFSLIKSSRLSPKVPEHLALLDPFVSVLARNLRGRKDDVLSISLRCLTSLLKYPLSSIEGRAGMLAEATIHLLQKANSTSELFRMCFKALARVLVVTGSKKMKNIPDTLWSIVIGHIRETLETDTPQHALELFRAMVGKKIMLAEMYDVMKRINQLLVQTRLTTIRGICEQIIATFILTYPLEAKRLEQQLEFIMANLTFPESNGRLAIMELLKVIFHRFPEEMLNRKVQYFFLPLVAQMVNDDFAQNRAAAAQAIESLYVRVSKDQSDQLLQTALKWYEDDVGKTSLQRAAAQLIMVFASKLGADAFAPFAKRLLPTFLKRLEQVTNDYEDEEDLANFVHVSDEQWQGVYFTLLAVEKSITLIPSMVLKSNFVSLWRRIASPQLLSFPHPWVRLLCARLLGTYFDARKESMPIRPQSKEGTPNKKNSQSNNDWLTEPRRLFSMSQLFCEMLTSLDLSEELGTQVIKNLYWLTLQLQAFPDLTPKAQIQAAFMQTDDQLESADEKDDEEEEKIVRKKKLTVEEDEDAQAHNGGENGDEDGKMDVDEDSEEDSKTKASLKSSNGDSEADMNAEDDREKEHGVPAVNWIMRRLSHMAKSASRLGKTCIFKYFAAVTMTMEASDVKDYLVYMLFPLFRANELAQKRIETARKFQRAHEDTPEVVEFNELVDEVSRMLSKKVGTTYFYEVHERVRARIYGIRARRKSELAIQAVVNPARAALRKAARHEQSKQRKKRKIEAHMAHRTTHRLKLRKNHE